MSSLLIFLVIVAFLNPCVAQDTRILVAEDAPKRVLIPSAQNGGDKLDAIWHALDFDDSAWRAGKGGVGLEARGEDYRKFISIDVEKEMYNKQTSAFIRIPFTVEGDVPGLLLRVRYDDGFVAYLNGVEVARALFTGEPKWNSVSGNRMDVDESTMPFGNFDISKSLGALKRGKNLLAIHGMQDRPSSSDFLVSVELRAATEAEIAETIARAREAEPVTGGRGFGGRPDGARRPGGLGGGQGPGRTGGGQGPRRSSAQPMDVSDSEEPAGAEWVQYQGPNQDGISRETGLLKFWPAQVIPA
jgi:hypothetical protein